MRGGIILGIGTLAAAAAVLILGALSYWPLILVLVGIAAVSFVREVKAIRAKGEAGRAAIIAKSKWDREHMELVRRRDEILANDSRGLP